MSKLYRSYTSSATYLRSLIMLITVCIASYTCTFAQTSYPVLASMQINPPYSLYLSDYSAPDFQRMQVQLLLKDLTVSDYKCRLKIKIEGFGITLQSKPAFYTPPIILQGGEMTTLSGPDLATYLNPQNLLIQGLDNSNLSKQGAKLPEGIYKFSVEVVDYSRNVVVSNQGNAMVSTFLSYPPIINLPMANTKVTAMEPQNVVFQWVPRHTASFNAAFNVAYKFRLVELIPADRDPNDALRTIRPTYESIIAQTMLVYGPGEPALKPGSNYAVQVQAIEAEGKDMFVNDGFSEAVKFTYGEKCSVPADLIASVAGKNELKLSWAPGFAQQSFTIRYRETGDNTSAWYEETSYLPQYTITGLKPGKKYEYQVNGQCTWGYGDYTAVQSFTMPNETLDKGDFVCGKSVKETDISNRTGLDQLKEGDVITAGDFKVEIKTATGTKGKFSGTGKIKVPFLNAVTLPVVFKDISVNTDRKMYAGTIELQRENETAVSDKMDETLDKFLDNITDIVADIDTAGLKSVDAAGFIQQIDKMKGWDELDNATLEKLAAIETKLQELQQLQDAEGITPEEKASAAKKIAEELKKLAQQAKELAEAALEAIKNVFNLYKTTIKKLRTEYTDAAITGLQQETDKAAAAQDIAINTMIDELVNVISGIKTADSKATGDASVAENTAEIIDMTETTLTGTEGVDVALKYKTAESKLNQALLVRLLEKEQDDDELKQIVIKALKVKDVPFTTFYKTQKEKNVSDEEMVPDMSSSLIDLIIKVLRGKQ